MEKLEGKRMDDRQATCRCIYTHTILITGGDVARTACACFGQKNQGPNGQSGAMETRAYATQLMHVAISARVDFVWPD